MNQAKPKIRLYLSQPFSAGQSVTLTVAQSHYVAQVMRLREGDALAVFNGSDGEWRAEVSQLAKKSVVLRLDRQVGPQKPSPDLWLAFVPVKNKTDIIIEKAAELGVRRIHLAYSRYAVVKSVNRARLEAHAVEAAEQSGRCDVPSIEEHKDLAALLAAWPKNRTLLYGDESGGGRPLAALLSALPKGAYGVLIGPEGGFSPEEHHMLKAAPMIQAFGMGPRILRADTAAVAALACVQAQLGDWEDQPHFEAHAS